MNLYLYQEPLSKARGQAMTDIKMSVKNVNDGNGIVFLQFKDIEDGEAKGYYPGHRTPLYR